MVYAAPCGNGVCQASRDETCSTCPQDCGICPSPSPTATPVPQTPTPPPTILPTPTAQPTQSPGTNNESANNQDIGQTTSAESNTSDARSLTVSFNQYSLVTNNPNIQLSGVAVSSGGIVSDLEYSIDAVNWVSLTAADGSFNSSSENFIISTTLPDGRYVLRIRAIDSQNLLAEQSAIFTISTEPPEVSINDFDSNPTKNLSPVVFVSAKSLLSDIVRIELSSDGGNTWIRMVRSGQRYQTQLENLQDGNYELIARAFDSAGNVGRSEAKILIVDTIPPIIGGSILTAGPLVIPADENGIVHAVTNLDFKYTIRMKGGVTEATVTLFDKTYDLKQLGDTQFWSLPIEFFQTGKTTMSILAKDGAGNETDEVLGTLFVEEPGILEPNHSNLKISEKTRVSVYQFQPFSNRWQLWDADSFGQINPYITSDGEFAFILPRGKYYLQIEDDVFGVKNSDIFSINSLEIINPKLLYSEQASKHFSIGGFSIPSSLSYFRTLPVTLVHQATDDFESSNLPDSLSDFDFELPNTDGAKIQVSEFLGKNIFLSYISVWTPNSAELMSEISRAADRIDSNNKIIVIFVQESVSSAYSYKGRGRYGFEILADETGESATDLASKLTPTHYFINKNGTISNIEYGVIDAEYIVSTLNKL